MALFLHELTWEQNHSCYVHYMQLYYFDSLKIHSTMEESQFFVLRDEALWGWGSSAASIEKWRSWGKQEKPGVQQYVAVLEFIMGLTDFVLDEYGLLEHNRRSYPCSPGWKRQGYHGHHTQSVLQGPVAPREGKSSLCCTGKERTILMTWKLLLPYFVLLSFIS